MIPDAAAVWAHRLEATSSACADVFRAVVPQIGLILETAAFDRWAGQGLTLAQTTWRGAECAAWYFRLSPQVLARRDLETLIRLTEPTLWAMQVSPQLGIELLRGAARFVERDRQVSIETWVALGERLAPVGRSGGLAAAYFEVSPEVLSLAGLSEFQAWTEVVQTLAGTTEVLALEFVRQSPLRLEKIPPPARLKALRLAQIMARHAPTITIDVLRTLPDALHAVVRALHDRLLNLALGVAEAAPRHLDRLLRAMIRLMQ